jgi:RNA-directed DNA polymerase
MWQISQAQVDVAYQWLCAQRKHYPPNADIWHFRFHWPQQKASLIQQLEAGDYVFSPIQLIKTANGKTIHLWGAQDALVLKIMALQLQDCLVLSPACTHQRPRRFKACGGANTTATHINSIKRLSLCV